MKRVFSKLDTGSWIEGTGLVRRLIPDDNDGARHQRFVLDLRNGQTVLVAHNIDLAGRVPVGIGDRVRFRGIYEWNDLGGLVHWTHRDPLAIDSKADSTSDESGYIRYRGREYS